MKQNSVSEEKFDKAIGKLKGDIFDRLDDVVEQLETIRQEQIMAYGKDKEIEDEIKNHDKRITALEHLQP